MRRRNGIFISSILLLTLAVGFFQHYPLALGLKLKASLLGLAGMATLGAGFFLLWRHWLLMSKGVRTKGKVIALPVTGGWDRAKFPVVKFNDLNGVSHTVRSMVSSSYGPRIGREWDVCYNPDNPEEVIFGSLLLSWIARMLLGCAGAVMLVFAWVCFNS